MKDSKKQSREVEPVILPCKQCGSPANELEWSQCREYSGIQYQSAEISCSGANNEHCPVEVACSVDTLSQHDSEAIERALVLAWNAVNAG